MGGIGIPSFAGRVGSGRSNMKPLRLHGLLFGRGEGGGVQVSGTVVGIRQQRYPGYVVEPEESAQELGTGRPCFEGRECLP